MRRTYKALLWRATCPVNTADCMNEWKYVFKYNINISIIIGFKQYLPSIIQSVEFTGRVTRQNNGLYVLRMIVKLAYIPLSCPKCLDSMLVPGFMNSVYNAWWTFFPLNLSKHFRKKSSDRCYSASAPPLPFPILKINPTYQQFRLTEQ